MFAKNADKFPFLIKWILSLFPDVLHDTNTKNQQVGMLSFVRWRRIAFVSDRGPEMISFISKSTFHSLLHWHKQLKKELVRDFKRRKGFALTEFQICSATKSWNCFCLWSSWKKFYVLQATTRLWGWLGLNESFGQQNHTSLINKE